MMRAMAGWLVIGPCVFVSGYIRRCHAICRGFPPGNDPDVYFSLRHHLFACDVSIADSVSG